MQTDIKWLLVKAEKLEDVRNNIIHSPLLDFDAISAGFLSRNAGIQADDLTKNPRALKLATKNLLPEISWCRDMATTLRDYALLIDEVIWDKHEPWPSKPPLPPRGVKPFQPRRRKKHKPTKRLPLPQASQG
jgi:hypothetical protein